MALLDATNLLRARIGAIRQYSLKKWDKPTLDAAVSATDSWIDTNSASYASSLPAAFRTTSNAAEKTLLFCVVALRRAGVLQVAEDNS